MLNTPIGSITDRELKMSYWYVTHKLAIKKWLVVLLLILTILLWFYVGWQLVFYAINSEAESIRTNRLLFSGVAGLDKLESTVPQQLQFAGINLLAGQGGRNDFYIQVFNPNPNWLATFDYQFIGSELQAEKRRGFVLPGQQKYLMGLGLETKAVQVEVTDQKWQRINHFAEIKEARLRFSVTNEKYISSQTSGESNKISFALTNYSPYNYWETGVQAILYSRGKAVTVNYVVLDQLKTGETRQVEMHWNEELPKIDSLEIIPDINILDEDNIMPQDSPIGL